MASDQDLTQPWSASLPNLLDYCVCVIGCPATIPSSTVVVLPAPRSPPGWLDPVSPLPMVDLVVFGPPPPPAVTPQWVRQHGRVVGKAKVGALPRLVDGVVAWSLPRWSVRGSVSSPPFAYTPDPLPARCSASSRPQRPDLTPTIPSVPFH